MRAEPFRPPFVLMYHSVADHHEDPYQVTVSQARFAKQMRWFARRGLRGVSMRDLLAARAAGRGRRMFGLTFDDGYADFATNVLPVLARHRFTATVFAVVGRLGGHNDWDPLCPRKTLMTAQQLQWAAAHGVEIASHGLHHRALSGVDTTTLVQEIEHSRKMLQDLIGSPVTGFSYPYGDRDEAAILAVRAAGYDYACADRPTGARDRHALPRTYVGEADHALRLEAKRLRHWLRGGRP
jgi:peptidoglycan/xylan/chitin deacetylase (PgdA/CDA1 family)